MSDRDDRFDRRLSARSGLVLASLVDRKPGVSSLEQLAGESVCSWRSGRDRLGLEAHHRMVALAGLAGVGSLVGLEEGSPGSGPDFVEGIDPAVVVPTK